MAEYYSIVADEKEIKRFFQSALNTGLKDCESYMLSLSCRHKKLTEEQRQTLGVGRSEMIRTTIRRRHSDGLSFQAFKESVYAYECRKEGLLTKKGFPYPEEGLVLYLYLNPCSDLDCLDDTVNYILQRKSEMINHVVKQNDSYVKESLYKLSIAFDHYKSCHAQHPSRKVLIDFDLDVDFEESNEKEAIQAIRDCTETFFNKGSFWLVRTSGGIHIVVRSSELKFNPTDYTKALTEVAWKKSYGQIKECIYNKNCMIPLPGTFQYGKPVYVLNWDDFESEESL